MFLGQRRTKSQTAPQQGTGILFFDTRITFLEDSSGRAETIKNTSLIKIL